MLRFLTAPGSAVQPAGRLLRAWGGGAALALTSLPPLLTTTASAAGAHGAAAAAAGGAAAAVVKQKKKKKTTTMTTTRGGGGDAQEVLGEPDERLLARGAARAARAQRRAEEAADRAEGIRSTRRPILKKNRGDPGEPPRMARTAAPRRRPEGSRKQSSQTRGADETRDDKGSYNGRAEDRAQEWRRGPEQGRPPAKKGRDRKYEDTGADDRGRQEDVGLPHHKNSKAARHELRVAHFRDYTGGKLAAEKRKGQEMLANPRSKSDKNHAKGKVV